MKKKLRNMIFSNEMKEMKKVTKQTWYFRLKGAICPYSNGENNPIPPIKTIYVLMSIKMHLTTIWKQAIDMLSLGVSEIDRKTFSLSQ